VLDFTSAPRRLQFYFTSISLRLNSISLRFQFDVISASFRFTRGKRERALAHKAKREESLGEKGKGEELLQEEFLLKKKMLFSQKKKI